MSAPDYATEVCSRLDLDPRLYVPVIQALLHGQKSPKISENLHLHIDTTRSRINRVRKACRIWLEAPDMKDLQVHVGVFQVVVALLEDRLQTLSAAPRYESPWPSDRIGERECRMLGLHMTPYIEEAVLCMRGTPLKSATFANRLLEQAWPYLKRYLGLVRRPIDPRICILAVRASYFEDECAWLRAFPLPKP